MLRKMAETLLLLSPLIILGVISCNKPSRPALGTYPVDNVTLPGGDLRFFVNFDSTSPDAKQINIRFKDSISGYPSFFPNSAISFVPGIKGTAYKGADGVALEYVNANDFASASSFTVAFWEKAEGVPKSDAQFVMSLVDKDYWHNSGVFLLFDHQGAGSTADSAAVTFAVKDNWYVFHNKDRIPKIYDKGWHHMAFVYDETTSKLTTYIDGHALTGLSNDATSLAGLQGKVNFTPGSVSNLVLGGWNKHVGLPGPTDDWIKSFPGSLDQFRLYNKALSASDILALFNSKL